MPSSKQCLFAALSVLLLAIGGCSGEPAHKPNPAIAESTLAIIPAPVLLQRHEGAFVVDADTPVIAEGAAGTVADRFIAQLAQTGRFSLRRAATARTAITFVLESTADESSEGYVLDVSPNGIRVAARSEQGLYRGAMTLWQLLVDGGDGPIRVAALHIEDAPRFAWRGLMIDSARHFLPVEDIKRVLDAMAQHKFNRFHWHLTDDQGWRVEIKRHPELATTGGCRIPLGDAGIDPRTGAAHAYCAYYTQEQIRDIVRYAAERYITVMPEFDVPGHAQAAVAAYPELGVLDQKPGVSSEWGINTYLFNVEESTFVFLDNVFSELMDLFPGAYIHVGGDEAVKQQWKNSARVQQRMRELGAKDEEAMQALLIERIGRHLATRGRILVGWDEILEGGAPRDAVIMSWRGIQGGIEAARHGNDVIMSPSDRLYLDYLQTDSPNEVPGRPTYIPLKMVYDYEPIPAELTADEARHILGAQANVWSEHLRTPERVERAIFPRAAALAEVLWTPVAQRDWNGFLARLPTQFARYERLGVAWSTTAFEARIAVDADPARGTAIASLSNSLDFGEIRYTLDGSEPNANSTRYAQPLSITLPAELRATAFLGAQPMAPSTRRVIDMRSLRERSNHELASCTQGLPLRLEDDGPFDGPRAIYTADIFNPCWLYRAADLDGIQRIAVRAGRMPYNFQLAGDEAHRKWRPARSAHGEFDVRAGCDGELLASRELPAQPGADGHIDLELEMPARSGKQDLCLYFTGDTRPTYWVVDTVRLLPRAQ